MILTPDEKRAALESAIEVVQQEGFELVHVALNQISREESSDVPGFTKWADTGVVIISIIGNVPVDPDSSYGAKESIDADSIDMGFVDDDGRDNDGDMVVRDNDIESG